MRLAKKLVLIFFLLFAVRLGFAQSKTILEADTFFTEKNYRQAFYLYEKEYSSNKKKHKDLLLKMADCNYYMNNYPVAQDYYAEYFAGEYSAAPQYTTYAAVTKSLGKINEALTLYQNISRYSNNNSEAKETAECLKLYLDSVNKVKVYCLDSTYTCVNLLAPKPKNSNAEYVTYLWDFQDGYKDEGIHVKHCFKKPGRHEIILTIYDETSEAATTKDSTLVVYVNGPAAKFISPRRSKQYFNATFDATKLKIPDYEILEYVWDLGNSEVRAGNSVQFKYDKLGQYDIKLTVVAKNVKTGNKTLFSSYRTTEVVDNYGDRSKTFQEVMKEIEQEEAMK